MIIVPDIGGAFSTWVNQEQFTYRGHSSELCYQTKPPHGDFIYSLTLLQTKTRHRLPLWIFGRSLFSLAPFFCLWKLFPSKVSANLNVLLTTSAPLVWEKFDYEEVSI